MKRSVPLLVFLVLLSVLSGYLMSKASLVGRMGIDVFYQQYQFLKVWWQGALVVFIVLLLFLMLQGMVQNRSSKGTSGFIHIIAIALAAAGLYFTYQDFRHDLSHRFLGERFHLGAYLFWIGWIGISLFYLFQRKTTKSRR